MGNKWLLEDKLELNNGTKVEYLKSHSAMILESFELAILFSSSESRTLEYRGLLKKKCIQNSIYISFDYPKDNEKRRTNDLLNIKYLKKETKNRFITLENLEIVDIEKNISLIINKIKELKLDSNQKWFIDITAPPLSYTVSLIGYCNNSFPRPQLTLLNVSGHYKSTKKQHCFTEGFRKDINLPFFKGDFKWGEPVLFVFLLGFEGHRSLKILINNDPDYVIAMIASPGYQKGYEEEAIKRNNIFLQRSFLKASDLLKSDVGNPISTYRKLQDEITKFRNKIPKLNICYVPIGPKPHAIGATLSAIQDDDSSILYEIPYSYILEDVQRNEELYLYKITF